MEDLQYLSPSDAVEQAFRDAEDVQELPLRGQAEAQRHVLVDAATEARVAGQRPAVLVERRLRRVLLLHPFAGAAGQTEDRRAMVSLDNAGPQRAE